MSFRALASTTLASVVLAVSLLPGCSSGGGEGGEGGGPPPVDCDAPADPQTFEVGTGELCFERADGALVLWAGPQGGYHLFAAVGCADCEDEVTLDYVLLDPATDEVFPGTYPDNQQVLNLGDADGWKFAAGIQVSMPGFQWDDTDPPPPAGTPMRLHVSVTDGAGMREMDLDFVLGETEDWDPCDANPGGPCCDGQCN